MSRPCSLGLSRAVPAALALAAAVVGGCVAPSRGAAGAPGPLYVANALDGTVTRLDAATGQALGPPLPAGPAPFLVAAAPNSAMLVLSAESAGRGGLTHVGPAAGGGAAHPLAVEPGAQVTLLAGDGAGRAVAAYGGGLASAPGTRGRCGLALVDVGRGAVERTHPVCADGEEVAGLALTGGPTGATAYVALWRGTRGADGPGRAALGRVLAVDMETGAVVAAHRLESIPGPVARVTAGGAADGPIFAVEATPRADGPAAEDWGAQYHGAAAWRLLALDPATLEAVRVYPVPYALRWPVPAPDGGRVYATAGPGSLLTGSAIAEVDLATGATRILATVPGWVHGGLAVTEARLYVPDVEGHRLTVLDRRTGRALGSVPTGRHPLGIAAGGA